MKRILAFTLILCCFAISVSAEVISAQTIDFPAFSFSTIDGAFFIRGEDTVGMLFAYYPEYAKGDESSSIIASSDTMIQYNPLTMTDEERQQFATDLKDATVASLQPYGIEASYISSIWSDPFEVDGQTGIMMSYHYEVVSGQANSDIYGISCFFCIGEYRYNLNASSDSEAHCQTLLTDFFETFSWK